MAEEIQVTVAAAALPSVYERLPDGTRLLGTLPAGTRFADYDPQIGGILAVHPDHPPRLITPEGILDSKLIDGKWTFVTTRIAADATFSLSIGTDPARFQSTTLER